MYHVFRYSEEDNNCFDFVLGFLKNIGLSTTIPSISSRVDFCSKFILGKMKNVKKYITLYREIMETGPIPISSNTHETGLMPIEEYGTEQRLSSIT